MDTDAGPMAESKLKKKADQSLRVRGGPLSHCSIMHASDQRKSRSDCMLEAYRSCAHLPCYGAYMQPVITLIQVALKQRRSELQDLSREVLAESSSSLQ